MKIVPIVKNVLAVEEEDWERLITLTTDLARICNSESCESCPLGKFCEVHTSPSQYLNELIAFLDN